jgi:hopanoid-associated phosphorylase
VSAVSHIPPVIAVSGLSFESRIAAGAGVYCVCSGDRQILLASLGEAVARGASGIISFGTAGALVSDLRPGCWIVADAIISGKERLLTNLPWSNGLKQSLPGAVAADIAGVNDPLGDVTAKHKLHQLTRAVAVDMESHFAAHVAAAASLPFAAFRVIIDPLHRKLPPAALIGQQADGTLDLSAIIASLLRSPYQLPAITRIAIDARSARNALLRGRRLLGAGLGLPDFRLLE